MMNITISEVYNQAKDIEKGKIEIMSAIPFVKESTVGSERTEKNKNGFIAVICKYRSSTRKSKRILV